MSPSNLWGVIMSSHNGRLPVEAARKLCEDHGLSQVVIIAKTQRGAQVCMTYGVTQKDNENAAIAGRFWERVLTFGSKCGSVTSIKELLRDLGTK